MRSTRPNWIVYPDRRDIDLVAAWYVLLCRPKRPNLRSYYGDNEPRAHFCVARVGCPADLIFTFSLVSYILREY